MTRATSLLAALCLTLLSAGTAFAADGDYNADGAVDEADLQIIKDAMGSGEGDERFVAAADHNGDGMINVVDLADFHQLMLAN